MKEELIHNTTDRVLTYATSQEPIVFVALICILFILLSGAFTAFWLVRCARAVAIDTKKFLEFLREKIEEISTYQKINTEYQKINTDRTQSILKGVSDSVEGLQYESDRTQSIAQETQSIALKTRNIAHETRNIAHETRNIAISLSQGLR